MFHRTFSRLALARGWLRLFVLRVDGEPAAAFYGFRYGPRFSFYQSGFAPAAARDGVGTVCMAFAIQRAIEEGALEYDFLHGDEAYKFHWARQVRTLERLQLFPPRLAGALWKGAVGLDRKARRMARRVLPAPVVERLTAARREREVRDVPVAAEG
jgi:CelD/BcsL family acetyltransferase involved in cellulose biosynthesis